MIRLYRIEKEKYKDSFPPTGSLFYPGRWHKKGMWVVYASESIALAKLETLANSIFLPKGRILRTMTLSDDREIKHLSVVDLPFGWDTIDDYSSRLWNITSKVMDDGFLGLRVPSVISHREFNYVLFPQHPGFVSSVTLEETVNAYFDIRLKKQ